MKKCCNSIKDMLNRSSCDLEFFLLYFLINAFKRKKRVDILDFWSVSMTVSCNSVNFKPPLICVL